MSMPEPTTEPTKKSFFSYLAIVMPILFFSVVYMMGNYYKNNIPEQYQVPLIVGIIVLFATGLISSIISFIKKEGALKWMGAFINAAIIIFYIIVIVFK